MIIDLVQLRTFVTVAEEQHLTRAAERLHISQSAASAHVRAVEETLDTKLFVRTNRSLELTRAGQMLLQKAKGLLNEAALFSSYARELHGKIEGNLVVGAGSEPSSRIAEIVAMLRTAHPLVTVDVFARPSQTATQALKSGEVDIAVLLGRPTHAGFTYHHLMEVKFVMAGPAAWRERLGAADWSELAALPWITPSGSSAYSAMLAQLFSDKGLDVNSVVRFDNASHGRAMVKAGVGVMLLREDQALEGEREGSLVTVPTVKAEYSLCVAHQASRRDDPLVDAFVSAAGLVWPNMKTIEPAQA